MRANLLWIGSGWGGGQAEWSGGEEAEAELIFCDSDAEDEAQLPAKIYFKMDLLPKVSAAWILKQTGLIVNMKRDWIVFRCTHKSSQYENINRVASDKQQSQGRYIW